MSIYYPNDCGVLVATYTCQGCPTKEGARVRHVWAQKDTFDFVDPTDEDEWNQAIEDGDILVIPDVRGSFDGGTATVSEGFGDTSEEFESFEGVVTYTDKRYLGNITGYNALMKSLNYRIGFCTQTYAYLSENAASWKPKMPVQQDIKQSVYGEIEVKFVQSNLLTKFIYPQSIFRCFQVITP